MRAASSPDPGLPRRLPPRPWACGPLPAVLVAFLLLPIAFPSPARADAPHGPPPQAPPPPQDPGDDDDAPRRDFRMGTRDNMSIGRDKEGNLVMEISPRPRTDQNARQPPMYIYPQIYTGYGAAGVQGQPVPPGIQGQIAGPGGTPVGQTPPPMVYSPQGGPHGVPLPGQGGIPAGQTPSPPVHSPQGGPHGMIPAPPGPGRGAAPDN